MSDTAIFIESLRNRSRAMNVLWERAISDMTLEEVNHPADIATCCDTSTPSPC